ncbi:ribosome small subunit-dependent GTPase A [Alkalilimnicola ehrlichii]|uniref:Small ribosomal subunit biogenesis GTPase RsgA n=1 Tax=Alkalilimnicola ehrlichii TaxID=351052 RepID=A0A3E0X047_9GAMM|nr:ribosome small subunit-dependent GTPase A [Alkalilimnicola ehrlichii]RFA25127.1 ribosome small subunit-dependent GTPase A [Alkalilimnicola ehrlichii]RFA38792.1 ribosome small subunit-dependent GTPase A [Alkalilimnicola ehrlichii]
MSIDFSLLQPLGWNNHFHRQLTLEQLDSLRPARVIGVERDIFRIDAGSGPLTATLAGRYRHQHTEAVERPTIGDWVLLAADAPVIVACLARRSLISRRMAGSCEPQAIAANIDVLLIVSGLDAEFNRHRLERYLVLAAQAQVTPLVLLTKADLCADPAPTVTAVRECLPAESAVFAVAAPSDPLMALLAPWLGPGRTLALAGSSGVGKSTIVNNLVGSQQQATGTTRNDAKGRHTTTSRTLVRLADGSCIIDVPGMREVGLAPTEAGVERHFRSVHELALHCRFADCQHQEEPGCALRAALDRGELSADEWAHYCQLLAEQRHNVSVHERRRQERSFSRMTREALKTKRRKRE